MDIIGFIDIEILPLAPGFFGLAGSCISSLIDNLFMKIPASYVERGFGEFFLGYFKMIVKLLGSAGGG
jgi:hypothetical protein